MFSHNVKCILKENLGNSCSVGLVHRCDLL